MGNGGSQTRARFKATPQRTTTTARNSRATGAPLRMPNVRGKTLRHPDLAPAIAVDGSTLLPGDPVSANVNRSRRQVANSHKAPWRRP